MKDKTEIMKIKRLVCLIALGLMLNAWAPVVRFTPGNSTSGLPTTSMVKVWALEESGDSVFLPLVSRPPTWVDTAGREESRREYLAEFQGNGGIDSGWTGDHASCDAGTTSAAFRSAILRRINYFRSMAGIPDLRGLDDDYNAKAQAAALMMSVNSELDHTPTPDWICYSEAGREGAGSSDLYLGIYGPHAISGYMVDPGGGNYFVGHRRWILYPQSQVMGTGDIPPSDDYMAANALWVFDLENMWGPRPVTREPYVAWPPPGYVPYQVVYPRWSIGVPEADFSQARVTMTQAGEVLSVQVEEPLDGFGDNTLVWEPRANLGARPATDTRYDVKVSNVLIDGVAREFEYTVIVFNPIP